MAASCNPITAKESEFMVDENACGCNVRSLDALGLFRLPKSVTYDQMESNAAVGSKSLR